MKLSVIMPVFNQEALVLKALSSIPCRDDVEIIVVDDCSTDGSWSELKLYQYYSDQKIVLLQNEKRLYCGGSVNVGLDHSKGEYITQIDSDDYVYPEAFNKLLNMGRKEDLIFFCNEINNGEIWNPEKEDGLCDHVCWYRKDIVGDIRMGSGKWAQGWDFHQKILNKNPTRFYFDEVVYHYNYPREDSNYDLGSKGLLG